MSSLSQRLLGRMAAALFLLSGAVSLVSAVLPGTSGWDRLLFASIPLAAIAIGGLVWVLPWDRWPRWSMLGLAPVAFTLIALGNGIRQNPWTYAIYYIVAFVWIGVAHPRGTSLLVVPVLVVSYVAPLQFFEGRGDGLVSLFSVTAVCLLVGEAVAWMSGKLRLAESLDVRRLDAMESLVEATSELVSVSDPEEGAETIARLASGVLGGTAAVVLLIEKSGGVRAAGGHNWHDPELAAKWLDQPARDALTSGEVTVHTGTQSAGHLTSAARGAPVAFIPLLASTGPVALVMVILPEGTQALDPFSSTLARTFATQAGLSLERFQATRLLLDASMRDALTGVGNRRQADLSLQRAVPGDALVLIDLDHFKLVNDRWGHSTGDRVLSELGAFLEKSLRDGDSVARYGGEEFLLVLREAADGARAAVERLAEQWRAKSPATTFSAGVAVHEVGVSAQNTLRRADDALYAAKAAGRDRVRQAGDPTAEAVNVTL